jgi:hypothetical protein
MNDGPRPRILTRGVLNPKTTRELAVCQGKTAENESRPATFKTKTAAPGKGLRQPAETSFVVAVSIVQQKICFCLYWASQKPGSLKLYTWTSVSFFSGSCPWYAFLDYRPLLPSEKNPRVPIESPFKLTMSIDNESYSTVPDVIDGTKRRQRPHRQLNLELRLRFTNQSDKVVRLDKDCVHLSSTAVYDSPIVGPSEPVLPDDGMISHKGWACRYVASEKLLAIPPGGFHETTLKMKLEVVNQGPFHPPESLRPRKYFLEITMDTLWEVDGQDENWKEMRKTGVQVLRSVTSEHMGFIIGRKSARRRA